MSDRYTVFLNRAVHEQLNKLRGSRKRSVIEFIDNLAESPFEEGDFSEIDASGRTVYCKIIRDHAITYYPDHAVKELKVLELVVTP